MLSIVCDGTSLESLGSFTVRPYSGRTKDPYPNHLVDCKVEHQRGGGTGGEGASGICRHVKCVKMSRGKAEVQQRRIEGREEGSRREC